MVLSDLDRDRLIRHRQQFPALQNKHYFNFGGQGPMPRKAIAAIQTVHEQLQELENSEEEPNDLESRAENSARLPDTQSTVN